MSCCVNAGDGRSSPIRRSSQSRVPLSGARSPGKSASAACSPRSERPSSPGSGGGACASCGTNFHSVIHNPSCSCGPGGRMSVGGTTKSVRSATKAPTATSRASHRSTSSCKTAVPVITRATTGAGFRWTSALLPAAIRTASSQATPCSRATACAAAECGFASLAGRHGSTEPRRAVINQERESKTTPWSSLWCAASISRRRSTVRVASWSLRLARAAVVS